uniref:hypothetical protein n=1 Tax=Agathobacter sp. TaxID=2021311 RepID=UPI0040559D73
MIDLFSYNRAYDTIDGSHPTEGGMCTLANIMIREMGGEQVEKFLKTKEASKL